jgi:hypothetical protein
MKIYKFHSIEVLDFDLSHTYTSKAKTGAIHGQLDFKVPSKNCKDSQIASNFHEFWSKELHCQK